MLSPHPGSACANAAARGPPARRPRRARPPAAGAATGHPLTQETQLTTTGPLSFGQLSVMRAVQDLPVERWHESNLTTVWPLPEPVPVTAVRDALRTMTARHPSLRTVYDLSRPLAPRQSVHEEADAAVEVHAVDGAGAAEIGRITAQAAHRPFDLTAECAWRAHVFTRDGAATHVALQGHHIVADGSSKKVLGEDLTAALYDRDPLAPHAAYSLTDMAHQQRGDTFAHRRRAAERHWEKTLTASLEGGIRPDPRETAGTTGSDGADVVQGCLRSRASRAAAGELAERLGLSVPVVLLAAYAHAVGEVQDVHSLPMRLASSNRHGHAWTGHVTSMNQWTPLHIATDPTVSFADRARPLEMRCLQAYRNGMFDHDAIAAIRGRFPAHVALNESTWAFNHIVAGSSGGPAVLDESWQEAELTWEPVFLALGPRFYLRVTDNGPGGWEIRLRARGLGREQVAALLRTMHETLLFEASAAR